MFKEHFWSEVSGMSITDALDRRGGGVVRPDLGSLGDGKDNEMHRGGG